jgi:hypothetical protein
MNPDVFIPSSAPAHPSQLRPRVRVAWGARLMSLVGLAGTLAALGYAGLTVYRIITDSFVAPIILSKDSDMVIQSKLSLSRLLAERHGITARMEEDQTAIGAAEEATTRLKALRDTGSKALDWALALTGQQAAAGARDMDALSAQSSVIERMVSQQEAVIAQLKDQLAAGMIHKAEVDREEIVLQQMRIAALDNRRNRISNQALRQAALLSQHSLRNPRAVNVPATPEVLAQQDQLVKIDLEILKLEAEARSKRVQRSSDQLQLEKLDELLAEMRKRPIFRAIESSQNVAFVPYTQIDGVIPGADVHHCKLWGLFGCEPAGRVSEVLAGEVVAQDPWGTPMRGRYAILSLQDPRAAESQSLRVRIARHRLRNLKVELERLLGRP